MFKLILVAPDYYLYEAFQESFDYLPRVEIVNNYFEKVEKYDCLVSPANSFGMMDGGMDAAITKFFGRSLEERVQQQILNYCWVMLIANPTYRSFINREQFCLF